MKEMRTRLTSASIATVAGLLLAASAAQGGTNINVTIENTSPTGGFFMTPFWIAAHDGSFDSYSGGQPASDFPGLEELAEGGDTGPISAAFAASAAGLAGGLDATVTATAAPAPVFSPGESASFSLNVGDATINRYFSFASMIIPSNDLFIANGNPTAHEIFNPDGSFRGPLVIEIYGRNVNDAGTEVNDAAGGAAFSTLGGSSADEFNNISNAFDNPGTPDYLASFISTTTASGDTISSTFAPGDLIARITIVPAPGTGALLSLAGLTTLRRRRR